MDTNNRPTKPACHLTEEHDAVPLKQRLKMLVANKPRSYISHTESLPQIIAIESTDRAVKKDVDSISQELHSDYFLGEGRVERLLQGECHHIKVLKEGMPQECCIQRNEPNICNSSNQIGVSESNLGIARAGAHFVGDFTTNNLTSSVGRCLNGLSDSEDQAINIKTASPYNMFDGLDHIDLRERRRLLLSRKSLESAKPVPEDSASRLPKFVVGCMQNAAMGNETRSSEGIHSDDIPERSDSIFSKNLEPGPSRSMASQPSDKVPHSVYVNHSVVPGSNLGNFTKVHENRGISSSKISSNEPESCGVKDVYSEKQKDVLNSTLTSILNVKVEPVCTNEAEKNALDNSCFVNTVSVKSELNSTDAYSNDVIDHMLLQDRMNLRMSKRFQNLNIYAEDSWNIAPSTLDSSPISSEYAPVTLKRSRKRKKTATDSVETALEEDAPELLQVLVDKGVVVDEIKLYGQTQIVEALDDSLTEDSFTELEAVISKLFTQRHSLLKFPLLRGTKTEKISYCLACLISLVEQARYIQFRKWPVEWGWCRDLQSFIFVFARHHRIVLERPEYGYATYFFELLDSVPIDWQIKRLVTAMKLTSCSRITLIENKALKVGEDLTQAEAAVLTGYGWIPDTGLGTMLNYRDRVVHDRKNEKDSSEWRSKIGKLLMDGYNGGTIITDIPQKVIEYDVAQGHQIKLEL